jgi:hypothetical protein
MRSIGFQQLEAASNEGVQPMDHVKKLSTEVQVVLGCTVLYLVFSFFDWQQVSGFGITVGRSEWTGIGILAGLLAIALLVWEGVRLFGPEVKLGTLSEGHVSAALALLLAVFTVITFLTHGTARHWPAWIGLLLSLVIAVAAVMRARAEGVQMPDTRSAAATSAPAEPAPAEPAAAQPEPAQEAAPEAPEAPAVPEE